MFFRHFFETVGRKLSGLNQSSLKNGRSRVGGSKVRIEPLEERSLLSASGGFLFAPSMRDAIVSGHLAGALPGPPAGATFGSFASRFASIASANSDTAAVATHFVVSMPVGATIGVPLTVQLVAEDDRNHRVYDFDGTVSLASSDPVATLPDMVTFMHGRASAKVTFATPGLQTVTATDSSDATLVGSATTNVATPAVVTHFVVSLPAGAKTGDTVTAFVLAEDAHNHVVTTYNAAASLDSTDPGATLPVSVPFKNGRTSFQVTFATPGQQTVTVADSVDATLFGAATTNVVAPAVATHFVVTLTQGATAGVPVTVSLTATDAQNHAVSNYTGTANLASSDATATLPASATFKNGRATFQATFATTGQQTITATDSINAAVSGIATTNVGIPHFVVRISSGAIIGVPTTVQLVAQDAEDHLLSTYSGTANLTSSDSGAILPATVTFKNGRASFQVTFASEGRQTLTATDSVNASPVGTATVNVAPVAVVTHFAVYLTPGATTGLPATVRVVPLDAQNHFVSTYNGTVNLSASDSSATLPTAITFVDGEAGFFQVTFATTGAQTVTATDSVNASVTGTATTHVAEPAVATHFAVYLLPGATLGVPRIALVVALDAQNHFVPSYAGTANLSTSDADATLPASVALDHGYARFRVTFNTLGQQTLTATDSANTSLSGTASTNVVEKHSSAMEGVLSRRNLR